MFPLAESLQPIAQHELGEASQLSGVFGDGYEVVGWYVTVGGVPPAGEAFDAHEFSCAQRYFRLVVDVEFTAVEGSSQIGGQAEAPHAARLEARVVDLDTAGDVLGGLGGDVGALQEAVGVATGLGVDGDADRGVDVDVE